jgi:quinohemoprotein ethanol dehydrogenase
VAAIDPDFAPDKARALKGLIAFSMNCMLCHGLDAVAGGAAPDLRWSGVLSLPETFHGIVRHGDLLSQGMPRFDDLSPDTVEDIRFYLRARAHELSQPASRARPKTPGATETPPQPNGD